MADSNIFFYITNEVSQASLNNANGKNGTLVTSLPASNSYIKFTVGENGKFTLNLDGADHEGFQDVYLTTGYNVADEDEFVSIDSDGNPKASGFSVSENTSLGSSDLVLPTQNAVKTYADNITGDDISISSVAGQSTVQTALDAVYGGNISIGGASDSLLVCNNAGKITTITQESASLIPSASEIITQLKSDSGFLGEIGGQLSGNAVFSSKVSAQLSQVRIVSGSPTKEATGIVPEFAGQVCIKDGSSVFIAKNTDSRSDWELLN